VNLLILEKEDFTSSTEVRISDRRHRHMLEVQKLEVGDTLRAGELNGLIGSARVDQIDSESVSLKVDLQKEPPQTTASDSTTGPTPSKNVETDLSNPSRHGGKRDLPDQRLSRR